MIKLCDTALVLPLSLIFEKSISTCVFPDMWKRANVLPVHKKESSHLKKNYRPISLLPICGKIFEKIIFDAIYDHLCKNQLLTPKQSGFRPGDSIVNQLIAITQQIPLLKNFLPMKHGILISLRPLTKYGTRGSF